MKARIRLSDRTVTMQPRPSPASPDRVYSIDPGLVGTGWAEWYPPHTLTRAGVITPPSAAREPDWTRRVVTIVERLGREVITCAGCLHPGIRIYCEMMEWQESARGQVSWKKGDLQMTVFLTGYLAGRLFPCTFVPVPVRQWKGQLPKDVVMRRAVKTLGRDVCSRLDIRSHAWDAVGIGLYSLGVWA